MVQYYSLTHAQKRIWYTEKSFSGMSYENMNFCARLNGHYDDSLLEMAINTVIRRNDGLRIRIIETPDGECKQYFKKYQYQKIDKLSFRGNDAGEQAEEWLKEQASRPFELIDADLFYFVIIKVNEATRVLLRMHHLVADGWTIGVVANEIVECYQRIKDNQQIDEPKKFSYLNYILSEETYERSEKFHENAAFWHRKFEIIPVELNLKPFRNWNKDDFNSARMVYVLSKEQTAAITEFCKIYRTSVFRIFFAALYIYIFRVTAHEDIVIATPLHNRFEAWQEKITGMFVSTVPFRLTLNAEMTFAGLLDLVKSELKTVLEHQKYPYDQLVLDLRAHYETDELNLYNIMLSYQNAVYGEAIEDIDWYFRGVAPNPIVFHISDRGKNGQLKVEVDYRTSMFDAAEVTGIYQSMINIIQSGLVNPSQSIADIELMPEDERRMIFNDFNKTATVYEREATIQELFEQQVKQIPDQPAVVMEERTVSYRELDYRAECIAMQLRSRGFAREEIVGIIADRSIEMVVGILGILKAGGAYLPIDYKYPESRIKFMLNDSGAKFVLVQKQLLDELNLDSEVINLEDESLYKETVFQGQKRNQAGDLAYIMYTSGSSGKPKGVMVEHRNVVRLVRNTNYITFANDDRILQTGAIVFDASTLEVWGSLLNGLTLYLVDEDTILNPDKLQKALMDYKITILWLTSPLFNQLAQHYPGMFAGLKYLLVGGDVLSPKHINLVRHECPSLKVINGYGPTENTTFSTCYLIDKDYEANIPIGRPIANSKAYILDRFNKPVPVGVVGELCVAGDGVAKGYLNRAEMNQARFVVDPFNPGARMYKTGDLAYWLPDGNIGFIGRVDQQVKIRGFRIETLEIEHRLLKQESIDEAVVMVKKDINDNKFLCAYVVGQKKFSTNELRDYLLEELPDYMVPSCFVQIAKMPLTPNGKIDRNALPEPNISPDNNSDYLVPRNEAERILVQIWTEVLGIPKIGISDNFFSMGGDSIKSIQVIAKLKKYGFALGTRDLFKYPRISDLSEHLQPVKKVANNEIVNGEVGLGPIQKWFFARKSNGRDCFNQAVMFHQKEGFDPTFVRQAFTAIVEHHDALRMVYKFDNDLVVQVNQGLSATKLFDFYEFDYRGEGDYQSKIKEKSREVNFSMDLSKGPLVKLVLFKTDEGDRLLIVIHHLVVDGISWRIIFEDFNTAYQQLLNGTSIRLPDKTDSFQAWIQKVYFYSASNRLLHERKYWERLDKLTIAQIPKAHVASSNAVAESRSNQISLTQTATSKLFTKVNRILKTNINDLLLSALALAMKECFGLSRTLISLEGHGREDIVEELDITRTIGWFTSVYPFLLEIDESKELSDQIRFIKESLRQVPNKGVGYGILRYICAGNDNGAFKPEISFNYLGQFDQDLKRASGIMGEAVAVDLVQDPGLEREYTFDINSWVKSGKLVISLNYNQQEFEAETASDFLKAYQKSLNRIIAYAGQVKEIAPTPSDLGNNALSLEEFDGILGIFKDRAIEKIYPLTPMQQGILFHCLKDRRNELYFERIAFMINAALSIRVMEQSFNYLLARYEALRTVFNYKNVRQPIQIILRERVEPIGFHDISSLASGAQELFLATFIELEQSRGFDLFSGPLIRFTVIKLKEECFKVFLSFHHIILDGWCLAVIFSEFFQIYHCLLNDSPISLDQPASYGEYIKWLAGQDRETAVAYWRDYLNGFSTKVSIPQYGSVKQGESYRQKVLTYSFDHKLTKRLAVLAEQNKVTLNTVFQTVWGVLLAKYNNLTDVVFGTVVSGRNCNIEGIDKMVGLFINTVVVRIDCGHTKLFGELLNEVQQAALASEKYHHCPLYDIQSVTTLKQELVNHVLVFENYPLDYESNTPNTQNALFKFNFNNIEFSEQTNYDFAVTVMPGTELNIRIAYNCNVYNDAVISGIPKHMDRIFEQVVDNQNISLDKIRIVSENDAVVSEFNNTAVAYESNQTIHQLFEEQVRRTPDQTALVFKDQKLTYGELNRQANRLANTLRQSGVLPGSVVGLMIGRGLEMLVGILGILKAGGGYLPIDPEYPAERIQYMIADSGAQLLLTGQGKSDKLAFNGKRLYLDVSATYSGDGADNHGGNKPDDLAYVIYTSGSTGKPKGVMIEHRAVCNFIAGMTKLIDFKPAKTILSLTTISFDIFVLENLLPLTIGMKIVIAGEREQVDSQLLNKLIIDNRVAMIQATPSRMQLLMADAKNAVSLNQLTEIMIGGEALPQALLTRLKSATSAKIYNMYGPTETTVWSTVKELTDTTEITIGKPIANTRIYIIDQNGNFAPVGVMGELCIAGDGLARGYHNRPDLNMEKFTAIPFTEALQGREGLMYRTGDLARWLPDGEIEFIGRIDNQVKIRGYRIELGEIEKVLISHEQITDCAVVVRENQLSDKYLIGYYVAQTEIPHSQFKSYLGGQLPDYMIPGTFMRLDRLPLTPNGKLDRKALPEPSFSRQEFESAYVAPETTDEKALVQIWSDILARETIGVSDNFFEIGGNSLFLVLMHARLNALYPDKVSVADIFSHPTISKLAKFINGQDGSVRENVNFSMVRLPAKYFAANQSGRANDTIRINPEEKLYHKILQVCDKHEIEPLDFVLGMYFYLLTEVAECDSLTIQTMLEEELVKQVRVDLNEVDNVSEFFKRVRVSRIGTNSMNSYNIKSADRVRLAKSQNDILPLFIANSMWKSEFRDYYDLILRIDQNRDRLSMNFDFNAQRLGAGVVQKLAERFLRLIKTAV